MTKYYVYALTPKLSTDERTYAYVEDPAEFAIKIFDPAQMKYTGVVIEANTPIEANEIYNRPTEYNGTFLMADEPKETIEKRKELDPIEDIKDKLQDLAHLASKATTHLLAIRMVNNFTNMNKTLSELARQIRVVVKDNPEIDEEAIYERLKTQYIARFISEFKYTTDRSY